MTFEQAKADLLANGWEAVGPLFKHPGDLGPQGRKWHINAAVAQLELDREEMLKKRREAAAAKRKKTAAKKSGRQTAAN